MIVIDGRQSSMDIGTFANLEELLVKVMEEEVIDGHIVTDVYVNQEAFSEIYPHHAEDIEADEIQSVELRTVSVDEMAGDVTQELFTVIKILQNGAKSVASSLRQADIADGLELLQDLLDVTRNFLGTIGVLHQRFPHQDEAPMHDSTVNLDRLLTEMSEVMNDQDWLLLADLLEYEFLPACNDWDKVLQGFVEDIAATRVE
ncbi:MAG: hypothetical protein DELT_02890 [Desulfovibrio sp.]